ncbi:MAG: hypothetical protein QOD35_3526, partial [Nocardioidaceae bacterium]|nr:hypothetical protein [Nocardioidaceae bacterium]
RPLQADLFLDDRPVVIRGPSVGTLTVYDYRRNWGCAINTGFEATNLYLPRAIPTAASTIRVISRRSFAGA